MTERERAAIDAARRLLTVLETISGPPMRLAIARDELRAALDAMDIENEGNVLFQELRKDIARGDAWGTSESSNPTCAPE